jgi:hypothetical protein
MGYQRTFSGILPCLSLSVAASGWTVAQDVPSVAPLEVFQGLDELTARIPRLAERPYEQLWDRDGLYQTERAIFHDLETSNEVWSLSQELCTDLASIERRCAWSCDGRFISFIGNKVFWNHTANKLWQRTWAGYHYVARADGSGRRALWGRYEGRLRMHEGKFNTWDQDRGNALYFAEAGQLWRVILGAAERDNVSEPIFAFPPAPKGASHLIQDAGDSNVLLIEESGGRPMAEPRPCYAVDLRLAPTNPAFCRSFTLRGEGHPGSYRVSRGQPVRLRGGYEDRSLGGFVLQLDPARGLQPAADPPPAEDFGVRMAHLWYGPPDDRVAFSGQALGQGSGLWVQHPGQRPVRLATVNDGHPTWCGRDPEWFFYACGTGNVANRDVRYDRRLVAGRADGQELRVICTPFDRRRGAREGGYDAIPRPNQSPDATKCWFHSSMLMPDNKYTGSFIAVFRRPHPPTALRYAGGLLSWTPHTLSREVEGYLLYRREAGGWRLVAGPLAGTSAEVREPGVYMLTALEWSGLESDLSSSTIDLPAGAVAAAVRGFDRVPPPVVTGFAAATEGDGRFRLRWDRCTATDTRYYSLYFSAAGRPAISQARLILSPPAAVTNVLDWTAPKGTDGHYAIVAVDRQGNVSAPAYADAEAGVRW